MASNTLFQNIYKKAVTSGHGDFKTKEAIEWYRKNLRKMSSVTTSRLFSENSNNLVNSWTNMGMGKIYICNYQPKHRLTLPYYDTTPVIMPFSRGKDHIKALNFHYLPPIQRAILLDALYSVLSKHPNDERKRFIATYDVLKSASKFQAFKPCVKMYLGNHFRSRSLKVPFDSWATSIFLPLENFQKASKSKVWADSRKIIRG